MTDNTIFDVAVVGMGPTGLTAAALLASMNRRVVTIERHANLFGLPRAGHVDHEIVRVLQDVGAHREFLEDAFETEDYKWYNAKREVILSFPWGGLAESGYNSDFMMYQPVMEGAVFSALCARPEYASIFRGYEVCSLDAGPEFATLTARPFSAEPESKINLGKESVAISARYVIAADGARSMIRQHLGIDRDEREFNATWLDVDVHVKRPLPRMNPHQVCDPRRPAFISPLGKRHHRFEWCVLPNEVHAEFWKPSKAWELLAEQGVTSDDVEIVRQQVYTFEARIAKRWREGRVLLAGDAAHTMPPFMGQGACSGIRDAANIAWKLDLILRGLIPDSVLDSYQVEREPHTRTWIELSILSGDVSCTLDAQKAAERDAALLTGTLPPMPAFPIMTSGILNHDLRGLPCPPAGQLFIQRLVEHAGQKGMFDDVMGRQFIVMGENDDPRLGLAPELVEFFTRAGTTFTWMDHTLKPHRDSFVDSTGDYRRFFQQHKLAALVVRPDHYIYGGVTEMAELAPLLAAFQQQLANYHETGKQAS